MDNTIYSTEHMKGQHLLSEEKHEIEVRLKDGWTIYRIAKKLRRPYNTIKNEIKRGTDRTAASSTAVSLRFVSFNTL